MNLPIPLSYTFSHLINEIDSGRIKIPQFQRDFVWSKEASASLMDSIIKGYPIGTLIVWKTQEVLRSIRNIGGASLPTTPQGDFIQYVLDGQQRLTSMYCSLKGLTIHREKNDDYSEMYVDLTASDEEQIVIVDVSGKPSGTYIKLTDLVYGDLLLLTQFDSCYHSKLNSYRNRINSYNFSGIVVDNAPIDVATEIFTRLNVGGKSLSVFEIMVAKTYDSEKNFDLAEKYDQLLIRLSEVEYDSVPASTVLQTVSVILRRQCAKRDILKLPKTDFIEIWNKAVEAICSAVDYFRSYFRIPVSQLLPYNSLIVPFAYYFFHHETPPNVLQQQYLDDFFWRVSLSERYSSGLEARLEQDIKRMDDILGDVHPKYDYGVDITVDALLRNGEFRTSRSYIRAILCLYAYFEPKSFRNNAIVHIDNGWLKQANSKNYHHFFPKAYFKKNNWDESECNNVLNITFVDDYLNKREIGAKAPSVYMKTFMDVNEKINETMKTHLITDIDDFGILVNDYQKFIVMRALKVNAELKKRLVIQPIDNVS